MVLIQKILGREKHVHSSIVIVEIHLFYVSYTCVQVEPKDLGKGSLSSKFHNSPRICMQRAYHLASSCSSQKHFVCVHFS